MAYKNINEKKKIWFFDMGSQNILNYTHCSCNILLSLKGGDSMEWNRKCNFFLIYGFGLFR